ncbi:MAG: ABC transporter substrate-binding protein [Dehalococcoidales bacterium]|nr:ABC transporter substrate-binding protein [Dehalococcoidales bacterium]
MRKWVSLLVVLIMLSTTVSLAACSNTSETEESTYKVGAILSVTGAYSNLGVPEKQTLEMLTEEINAEGGINGRQLEMIIYDNESNAEKAATLATRLIERDEVLAILGPTTTGDSMAIIDTVTSGEIPLISMAAGISIITPIEERYWVFKTPQTEKEAVSEIYLYMQENGIKDIAIITDTSGFGAGGRAYLLSEKDSYGINILDDQTFSSGDTSMQSQLTHIKGTDAEAVIVWATDKESSIVASDMKALEMTIPLFASHGIANMAFINNAGEAANGVIFPAGKLLIADQVPATDQQQKILVDYKNDFESKYGTGTISTFGGHAYDALGMLTIALEKMDGDMTLVDARAKLRDEIEKINNFVGTGGVFTMSPQDHLGMLPGSLAMFEIVDGEWTLAP